MSFRSRALIASLAIAGLAACTESTDPVSLSETDLPAARNAALGPDAPVRINEFHYDNAGTDVGEAIEVIALAGTELSGWQVLLYNGSNGSLYNTTDLAGAVVTEAGGFQYGVITYPTNGIQNGGPDGIALVNPAGQVAEFISYEGSFIAANGPAFGRSSTDIGAAESSSTPEGNSLAIVGGVWVEGPNTFGASNGEAPLPSASINEIHYDNDGTDVGEAVEVVTDEGADLTGFVLVLYNGSNGQPYSVTDLGTATLTDVEGAGYAVVEYPTNGIQNGAPDGVALVDPNGVVLEFLSYEGTLEATAGPALGLTSTDIGVAESSATSVGESLARLEDGSWAAQAETFGGPNDAPAGPDPIAPLFISELHYDNDGTDVGEAVEISGPAGTDLDGWQVVFYNGRNGGAYGTISLTGTLASCQAGGAAVFEFSGIQNGSPDGLALVDPAGTVAEFISYEGSFTAADGPAIGVASVDIGVSESSATPIGQSLQKIDGVWTGPAENTFECQPPVQVFLSEVRLDQPGADNDEYLEIAGPAGASLAGVSFVVVGDNSSGNGVIEEVVDLGAQSLDGNGAFVVGDTRYSLSVPNLVESLNFENGDNPTLLLVRGFTGADGQDLDTDNDGTLEATPWSEVVDCLSLIEFLGQGPIYCDQRIGANVSFTPGHAKRDDSGWFSANFTPGPGDTPGVIEFDITTAAPGVIAPWGVNPPGVPTTISVSRSFVELPAGFNRALFINVFDDFRNRVEGVAITNESSNPGVATSDQFGNLTAAGTGTAVITFSAGALASADVTVEVVPDVPSGVTFQNNVEFGVPTDGNDTDDVIVVRDEYTASYNPLRNAANWVSWNLDPEHFGGVERCDCYTFDPQLAAQGLTEVVNFDYTGSGYSRGHMAMSVNRTATLPDNASTYYLTNILPQSSANNGGPWLDFEVFTNDQVRENGREAYVVAGGVYGAIPGTLKDQGKVQIPDYTFKVAVFLGRDETLADVQSRDDLEVYAIITPNTLSLDDQIASRGNAWEAYEVDIAEIEALTGYDVLSALPDEIERTLETGYDDFEALVDAAVRTGAVSGARVTSWASRLPVVRRHIARGNTQAAVSVLEAVRASVARSNRQGRIDAGVASQILAEADRVLENLQR